MAGHHADRLTDVIPLVQIRKVGEPLNQGNGRTESAGIDNPTEGNGISLY